MRHLRIVHAIPGRTRLRYPALRECPADAERIAEALAATAGVHDVRVRAYTGSILVEHDERVTSAALVAVVQEVLPPELVLGRDEPLPPEPPRRYLSKIAKLAAAAMRDLDLEVARLTDGSLDLGTLTTLGFFGVGALQLAFEREVETPPWFNLAWWGYRMFMTNEQEEIASIDEA